MENLEILFYIFSTISLTCAILVIFCRNPVHSILFLVLTFTNASFTLVLARLEFLAFAFIIVYVGAIAVLFLFVIMMLDIKKVEASESFSFGWGNIILFVFSLFFLLYEFFLLFGNIGINLDFVAFDYKDLYKRTTYFYKNMFISNNMDYIGLFLYTKYSYVFLICGFILFIAMFGAIILTLKQRSNYKREVGTDFSKYTTGYSKSVFLLKNKKE